MIDQYIKKYKIKKKRIPQVKKLYEITGDPRLSTFIINSTKQEPELVDFLINNYQQRAKKTKFKNPAGIINTMFQCSKIDYVSHKRKTGTEIPREKFNHFIDCGAAKIITLTNSTGEQLVFEVVKDHKGNVSIIYKDTIAPYE